MEGVMVETLAVQRGRNQVVEDEKQQLGWQVLHGPISISKTKKRERNKREHDDWFIYFTKHKRRKEEKRLFVAGRSGGQAPADPQGHPSNAFAGTRRPSSEELVVVLAPTTPKVPRHSWLVELPVSILNMARNWWRTGKK